MPEEEQGIPEDAKNFKAPGEQEANKPEDLSSYRAEWTNRRFTELNEEVGRLEEAISAIQFRKQMDRPWADKEGMQSDIDSLVAKRKIIDEVWETGKKGEDE